MHQKWIASLQIADEMNYKNYAKILRKLINKAEADYYAQMCDTIFQSIKTVWKNLNRICNFNCRKRNNVRISKIKLNSRIVVDPREIVKEFNDYFCNVGCN